MDTDNAAQDNTAAAEETATETTETVENKETTESSHSEQQVSIDPTAFVLPDGFGIDQSSLDAFLPLAKELNMTQEQAQKVVALHAEAMSNVVKTLQERQQTEQQAAEAEVKEMFGAEYAENMGKIQQLLRDYGGEEAINQPIYGNKTIMQTLLKIARDAGPGRFVSGRHGSALSDGQILFGDALKNV